MLKKNPETKQCTKCGEIKPLEDFYRQTLGKYGRAAECKICKRKYIRAAEKRKRGTDFVGEELRNKKYFTF